MGGVGIRSEGLTRARSRACACASDARVSPRKGKSCPASAPAADQPQHDYARRVKLCYSGLVNGELGTRTPTATRIRAQASKRREHSRKLHPTLVRVKLYSGLVNWGTPGAARRRRVAGPGGNLEENSTTRGRAALARGGRHVRPEVRGRRVGSQVRRRKNRGDRVLGPRPGPAGAFTLRGGGSSGAPRRRRGSGIVRGAARSKKGRRLEGVPARPARMSDAGRPSEMAATVARPSPDRAAARRKSPEPDRPKPNAGPFWLSDLRGPSVVFGAGSRHRRGGATWIVRRGAT